MNFCARIWRNKNQTWYQKVHSIHITELTEQKTKHDVPFHVHQYSHRNGKITHRFYANNPNNLVSYRMCQILSSITSAFDIYTDKVFSMGFEREWFCCCICGRDSNIFCRVIVRMCRLSIQGQAKKPIRTISFKMQSNNHNDTEHISMYLFKLIQIYWMYASPYQRTTDTQMKQPCLWNIGNEIKEGKITTTYTRITVVILRSAFHPPIHIATHFIY